MNLRNTTSVMALIAGMALAMPANAAEAEKGGNQLEEVIVTAQKRAENVQTAPLSISAVTGTNLAKDRVLTLEDLGHNMTGISFTANSPQANEINIRGVVNTRLTSPTADQSVSTFVDDVYVSRSGNLNSAFYDIERIEVVRGPQGVLLGKNVAGGAVNIISNPASFDPSGRITVTAGNYDLRQANGFVTGALTDSLAGRLSFQTIHHSGYARDIFHNTDLENLDAFQARAQLAFKPENSDFRASLIVDYAKDSNDGVNRVGLKSSTLPAGPNIWSGTRSLILAARGHLSIRESLAVWPKFAGDLGPTPQRAEHEGYNIILKAEKDVADNIRLTSITGYRSNDSFTLYDQTGLGPTNGYNFTAAQQAGANASLLFAEPVNFEESVHQVSQEVRLASTDESSRLDWIVGAYYLHTSVHQYNRFWGESLVLPTLSGESHWDDYGKNRDEAVFAQVGYKILDTLKLEVGARYTKDHKSGTQDGLIVARGDRFSPNDASPLTPLITNFSARLPVNTAVAKTDPRYNDGIAVYGASWSEVTPQATLRWTPSDSMMVYGTISKGFKGGGFQNDASNIFAAQTPYDPETVTNYEAGYKTELLDHTVRWNTAVYYMKYKNLQVQQTLASCLCNVISNAPGATIKGFESDLQWAPTHWLRAWGSTSYTHGTYDTFIFNGVNNSGHLLQRTPKWQAALGAEVTANAGSWEDALTARLAYRWQGRMPWAPENTSWEKSYGTLDGRVTLTSPEKHWSVSLFGKNLTDKVYRTNIIVFFNDEMSSFGAPRTYGVEVSAPF